MDTTKREQYECALGLPISKYFKFPQQDKELDICFIEDYDEIVPKIIEAHKTTKTKGKEVICLVIIKLGEIFIL